MRLFHKKVIDKIVDQKAAIPPDHLEIVENWAQSIKDGSIYRQNETQIESDFKEKIVQGILGYKTFSSGVDDYHVIPQFAIAGIVSEFGKSTQTLETLIRGLYPSLEIQENNQEFSMISASSEGVIVSDGLSDRIPNSSKKSVFIGEAIPNKILGSLDSVAAIVTHNEDRSSHASIVCRAAGVPIVNVSQKTLASIAKNYLNDRQSSIAIDTFAQKIMFGKFSLDDSHVNTARSNALKEIMNRTPLHVNANADTAHDLKHSVALGFDHAWPRSETLLYDGDTLSYFVAYLLDPENETAREKFIEGHKFCLNSLFNEAKGTRVAFRLLDPPSHEFLPSLDDEDEIEKISSILGVETNEVIARIKEHTETNPMIGHRGARLLLSNKGVLRAQAESMLRAWDEADPESRPPNVEMLVPFVMFPAEMKAVKKVVGALKKDIGLEDIPIKYGCMVEIPSILDFPEEIAIESEFIAFGTNDLVATTHGIARGDAYDRYLSQYIDEGLIEADPFLELPENLVTKMIDFCLKAKAVNPALKTDICGEQAITSDLTRFIESGALDSVSIGTETIPILFRSLMQNGLLDLQKEQSAKPEFPSQELN